VACFSGIAKEQIVHFQDGNGLEIAGIATASQLTGIDKPAITGESLPNSEQSQSYCAQLLARVPIPAIPCDSCDLPHARPRQPGLPERVAVL
jgi:hypothetical protein